MIQTGAFASSDPRRQVTSLHCDFAGHMDNVMALVDVDHTNSWLSWKSPYDKDAPHRPFLMLQGYLSRVQCQTPLGPADLSLADANIPVSYTYDFTDNELSDLVQKGLFRPGFQVPDVLQNAQLQQIPMQIAIDQYVTPDNVPITFIEPTEQFDNAIDAQTSGYTMSNFFDVAPDYMTLPQRKPEKDAREAEAQSAAELVQQADKSLESAPKEKAVEDTQQSYQDTDEPSFSFVPTPEAQQAEASIDDTYEAINKKLQASIAERESERIANRKKRPQHVAAPTPAPAPLPTQTPALTPEPEHDPFEDDLDALDDIDISLDDVPEAPVKEAEKAEAKSAVAQETEEDAPSSKADEDEQVPADSPLDELTEDAPDEIDDDGVPEELSDEVIEESDLKDDMPDLYADLASEDDEQDSDTKPDGKKPKLTATQREQIVEADRKDDDAKVADEKKQADAGPVTSEAARAKLHERIAAIKEAEEQESLQF